MEYNVSLYEKRPKGTTWLVQPRLSAGLRRRRIQGLVLTCRLYDSLPQGVLDRIREELAVRRPEHIQRETYILAEKYFDRGYGQCFLRVVQVARIVKETLLKYDGVKYKLFAWVIMPNHIHLLLRPLPGNSFERIMHSLKSYTASEANKLLGRKGAFWMRESFDRFIRDDEHFAGAKRYIHNNPVKAGLCTAPSDWEFGSAWRALETFDE
jgi:putative DNA methylase